MGIDQAGEESAAFEGNCVLNFSAVSQANDLTSIVAKKLMVALKGTT
jgi:hypothetical protein